MPRTRYESRDVDPAPLGEPLSFPFSTRVAPNRFMKVAMTERLATWDADDISASGIPTPQLCKLYEHWADGGWGIITTGNIIVDPSHLEAAGNMIIANDGSPFEGSRFEAYRKLAAAGKRGGGVFLGQLNHPGRQTEAALQPNPVSASAVQLTKGFGAMTSYGMPHAATEDEIEAITAAFVHAAVYLEKAGFDGIQLHAAHGYLLAQFLSPTTNHRTDPHGGPLPNRARLLTTVATRIRACTTPAFVLSVKINSVEFQTNGFDTAEAGQLVQLLETHGFDLIELSGGTYESPAWFHRKESTRQREAFFLEFAELVAPRATRARCVVTGGIRSVGAMVDALVSSGMHGVGLGRPSAAEPRLPREVLEGGVKGCVRPLVGDTNVDGESSWGMGAAMAGAHMLQMSLDQEPVDASEQKVVDSFRKGFAVWLEAYSKRSKRDVLDHVRFESTVVRPYEMMESP